jgi:hypothetical protein
MRQSRGNAGGSMPITEGTGGRGHCGPGDSIVEEANGLLENPPGVGANQTGGSRLDRFWSFGGLPADQSRDAKPGGLLQNATGVGQEQVRFGERGNKVKVAERFAQHDVGPPGKRGRQ